MTSQAKQIYKKIEKLSKSIFWTMLALIFVLGGTYMYFVNRTIWNVAAREKLQDEIVAYNSKLGEKEFEYIKSKGSITMDSARQLGFAEPQQVSFVTKEVVQSVAMR